jgi:hypothetical protein
MGPEMEIYREIESFERELVDPEIRKDSERIAELLSAEFMEFGSSGKVYRKRDVLDSAKRPGSATYQLSGFAFKKLGDKHILVMYQSINSYNEIALRSSIWVNENGSWQMLHHQSTVVPSDI